jgi:hypothetical protein
VAYLARLDSVHWSPQQTPQTCCLPPKICAITPRLCGGLATVVRCQKAPTVSGRGRLDGRRRGTRSARSVVALTSSWGLLVDAKELFVVAARRSRGHLLQSVALLEIGYGLRLALAVGLLPRLKQHRRAFPRHRW